ncbi:MAG: MBL fold metallo-hydrolase [Clostridiales bacterium]|nr:MBL fold metallo-hydrolase [Clostridiales bacterium]
MIKDVERKSYINIIYLVIIVFVLLTNIFSGFFSKLLYLKPNILETNETQIHFINVGQGDAIVISFASGETMLVDAGTKLYNKKLTRYLDNIVLKDKKIDYLVLSHTDLDHAINMEYIVDNYDIGIFYRPPIYLESDGKEEFIVNEVYENLINKVNIKNIPTIINDDSLTISVGNAKVSWIYPDKDDLYGISNSNYNNYSPVIILEENGKKAMLTGDIDSSIERALMNMYPAEMLNIDILKIAHHGSNGSTSIEFLEATSPDYAVVSVGENNYGHPSDDMLSRILHYDNIHNTSLFEHLYRTDRDGNIIVNLGNRIAVEFIDNIDKYSFTPFWIYTTLVIFILLLFMFGPYIKVWYKRWRYDLHNKRHKKLHNN